METTEKIVEAYYRYVKNYLTIANINCPGQSEIDLLAIDPKTQERFHIEVSVSISSGFSKLSANVFDYEKSKKREHKAGQRTTVGFFVERKFNLPGVQEKLKEFGFKKGNYQRVVVVWDWTEEALKQATLHNIQLKAFPEIIQEISDSLEKTKTYFKDDTLRTLSLYCRAQEKAAREKKKSL